MKRKRERKNMKNVRRAEEKDIPDILRLLSQVLGIHAALRPDLFIPGTTKYTEDELKAILAEENTPVYVAVDEEDAVLGYAFCIMERPVPSNNMHAFSTLYIDDLCVDERIRGQHVGEMLFQHVKEEARRFQCHSITLHVWEGNDSARLFYERMQMTPRKTMMELSLS